MEEKFEQIKTASVEKLKSELSNKFNTRMEEFYKTRDERLIKINKWYRKGPSEQQRYEIFIGRQAWVMGECNNSVSNLIKKYNTELRKIVWGEFRSVCAQDKELLEKFEPFKAQIPITALAFSAENRENAAGILEVAQDCVRADGSFDNNKFDRGLDVRKFDNRIGSNHKLWKAVGEYKSKTGYIPKKDVDVVVEGMKYKIVREGLGRGTYGGVHSLIIKNENSGELLEAAVKVPKVLDSKGVSKINKEAEIQAKASGRDRAPKLLYQDTREFKEGGTGKIVMEWFNGDDLSTLSVKNPKIFDDKELQREAGEALNDIHEAGIIHGDLANELGKEPFGGRNVVLREDGRVIFIDYGSSETQENKEMPVNPLKKVDELYAFCKARNNHYAGPAEGVYRAYMESGGFERIKKYLDKHPEQLKSVYDYLPADYADKLRKSLKSNVSSGRNY